MKKATLLLIAVSTLVLFSCGGNTDSKSSAQEKITRQAITSENLIGEWECIDITNGVTHMESIAKMQPHLIFNNKNKILSKAKLSGGRFISQKIGSYKIENGNVISKVFDTNLYMENDKLIIEDSSDDTKRIYKKIK